MNFRSLILMFACILTGYVLNAAPSESSPVEKPIPLDSGNTNMPEGTVAEREFSSIDSYARNAPPNIAVHLTSISTYLLKGCKNDMQKARAAFTWIANNIKYDDKAYNSGKIGDMSATTVLQRKYAVCQGYANLYKALAQAMGIEAEVIDGYAKGYRYRPGARFAGTEPNHSWNAVKVNGEWLLLDATWGATSPDKEGVSKVVFSPYWFNVNKYEFLFMHYPKDAKWLLIPQAITLKTYEEIPFLQEDFFQLGFNAKEVLDKFMANNLPKQLPETYSSVYKLKLVNFPLSKLIPPSAEANFAIICNEDVDIEFINDPDEWVPMVKSGNKYTVTLPLKRGDLEVAIKGKKSKDYEDFIIYKVK